MKNDFNTDDINIDIFRNEFKRYIKCGLTVDEAIKKFNGNNCFILNGYGFEIYRSLCGTIELEYVHYVGSITTDQEIENIRKDTKLKELYKKSEDQNKDQCFNTILSAYVKSYVEKLYEANKLLDDLIIDEKGPRHEFQVLSDIIKDLTDAKTALNKYLMVIQINDDFNMAKEGNKNDSSTNNL